MHLKDAHNHEKCQPAAFRVSCPITTTHGPIFELQLSTNPLDDAPPCLHSGRLVCSLLHAVHRDTLCTPPAHAATCTSTKIPVSCESLAAVVLENTGCAWAHAQHESVHT